MFQKISLVSLSNELNQYWNLLNVLLLFFKRRKKIKILFVLKMVTVTQNLGIDKANEVKDIKVIHLNSTEMQNISTYPKQMVQQFLTENWVRVFQWNIIIISKNASLIF